MQHSRISCHWWWQTLRTSLVLNTNCAHLLLETVSFLAFFPTCCTGGLWCENCSEEVFVSSELLTVVMSSLCDVFPPF
jgi:hypothetical protein